MNINIRNIPFITAGLFDQFAKYEFIQEFTLVGGTALALQLGHRQSEDLDFVYDGENQMNTNEEHKWTQIKY